MTTDVLRKFPLVEGLITPLGDLVGLQKEIIRNMGGMTSYFNMNEKILFITSRDALNTPLSGDKRIRVPSTSGMVSVDAQVYSELVNDMKPHLYAALSDEVTFEATATRSRKAVDRSLQWLDAQIAAKPQVNFFHHC